MLHLARKQLRINLDSSRVLHSPAHHRNATFGTKTTLLYLRLFASATQSCIAPKCCIWRENNCALFKTLCECYRVLQRTEMLQFARIQLCTNLDPLRVLHSPP